MTRHLRPRHTRRFVTLIWSLTLLISGLAPHSASAQANAGWEALPAETVFALRMPHTQAFLENLRANTLAGQRIFTAEKFEQVKQLIERNNQEDWDEMVADLAEYGFTIDDLLTLAQNNWGMGMVAQPRDGEALPRMVMIGWAEMDEADIDRVFAAIDKADAENAESDDHRRVDLKLAGFDVRRMSAAEKGMDREANWELPEGFETMTEEQMEAHWAEVEKINAAAQYTKIDETHVLLTRTPGRIAMAVGFAQSQDAVRELIAAGGEIDWDSATDVATVQDVFGNYLTALEGGAENSFAARIMAEPDAAAAIASEESLLEFYADGPQLIDLIGLAIASENSEEDAQQYKTVMDALGFNGLGVIAGSTHLSDGAMRLDLFSQMASPRPGLLGTLDGQTLPATPPAWVPAGVSYFHLAYDLSKLYNVIMDTVQQLAGPDVMQQVQMGNMMVQGQVQADIPTILRSLGIQHSLMVAEGQEITRQVEEYDFETESFKTIEKTQYFQPMAFVWELGDEAVWSRVMTAIKNFAPMAGADSGITLTDEAGFTGLTVDNPQALPMGIMLGQGKLVVGVGPDITTETMTLINTPPAGGESLAGSADFRTGDALINYQDGILFAIQNWSKEAVSYKKQLISLLDGEITDDRDVDAQLIADLKALLPSDADLKASFGVAVGQITMTPNGLVYKAAGEMPAAE